ncbi:substrate-binding periplasmic protein [Flexivirga caeni]|uniref:Amino acid ABC transporter substrate-binding protein n=1 Tax=Flexivirga caeni TaxID=2294115 RepID=A0A3M9MFE9_9MICO|nr:ABC transporter substrate-binding protein [Flexivirga caeni]RNI24266.1 amino acid ABC transporter substrate-binding protein [Flexivirga caeni]
MKTLPRAAVTVLAAALVAAPLASCSSKSSNYSGNNKFTIKVGTIDDYPPADFALNGKLTGYEQELLAAAAKVGNFTVTYQTMSFGALLTGIQSKHLDAAMAGMDITPERQKAVNFTAPTFNDHLVLGVPVNSRITSLADLKGKRIAGTVGSVTYTQAQALAKKYGGTATGFQSTTADYQDVQSGHSQALVMNRISMIYMIKQGKMKLRIVGGNLTTTPAAIAVAKGKPQLIQRLNAALKELNENGTVKKLQIKWFGEVQ